MRENKLKPWLKLFMSMLTNPLFVLVYGISFYELSTLCQFGRYKGNVAILLACILFYVFYLVLFIIIGIKKTKENLDENKREKGFKTTWRYIALVIMVIITVFFGVKIYKSATNYNGKLSWILRDLKNKRTIEFEHNNIYENGIEGIFTDINKKIDMADELYLSTSFALKFNKYGTITSFDTYMYGKDNNDKLQTYLISYDKNKSDKIIVYLNGYANATFDNDKIVQPLFDVMKSISIKGVTEITDEDKYGILYYGKRSWGYNDEGIVYVNRDGFQSDKNNMHLGEIEGYTVSIYVPNKEDIITPIRLTVLPEEYSDNNSINKGNSSNNSNSINNKKDNNSISTDDNKVDKKEEGVFYLNDNIAYKLEVTGAAMGKRSYALLKSDNGGESFKSINGDPFLEKMGVENGIKFLNEELGFLGLSHSGGAVGELYRTADGGETFEIVEFPEITVELSNGDPYKAFDTPQMPYYENDELKVLVGQGSDGDYNGNSKALYKSSDNGHTWEYEKEITNN